MSGQLSQERLNQIAGRKLAELGIAFAVGPDGRLVGDVMTGGRLVSPFTDAPIEALHFVVEAHDHLRFSSPPLLAGLPPLPFYDAPHVAAVVEAIGGQLSRRVDAIARLKAHFQQLKVEAVVDREHGVLVAPVNIAGVGTVVLIGDEQGVRSSHLRPIGGGANRPMPPIPIDLAEYADATDLALFVGELAHHARPADGPHGPRTGVFRPPPELHAPSADAGFGAMPSTGDFGADGGAAPQDAAGGGGHDAFMPLPSAMFEVPQGLVGGARGQPAQGDVPAGAVTAGMLARCLGDAAQLSHGVAVMRRFSVGGRALKLTLKQKRGRVFVGRIAFDDGVLWQGEVQVDKHPPMDDFIRELLKSRGMALDDDLAGATGAMAAQAQASPSMPAAQAAPAPARTPAFGAGGGEQLPVAGEVWVMNVVVEQQDANEVRYAAINAEGQPYGAPRILPKAEFDRVFAAHRGGYRLLVRVIGASPQQVVYVQLDPAYQPNSETRAIAPSIFLASFLPEAADY